METTVRTVKGITLFILTEDIDNILRIIKSLEKSDVMIDRVTETVKHGIKK